jgi:tetratricopeptide (TPR) repeat protein
LNQRTFPEIDKSTECFQRSIEKDPGFALGYAGLADSYLANSIRSPQDFEPKAKAAASRAPELDGDLAEAHAALGAGKADFEYDWPGAEQEFKRALELNPNYAEGHFRYALSYLMPQGQSENAIAEMKKALQLDPFSPIYNTVLNRNGAEILPYPLQRELVRNLAIAAEAAGRADLVPMWAGQSANLSTCTDVSAFLTSLVEEVSEIAGPVIQ